MITYMLSLSYILSNLKGDILKNKYYFFWNEIIFCVIIDFYEVMKIELLFLMGVNGFIYEGGGMR